MEKQEFSTTSADFDPDRILRTLIGCGVEFVLVGGLAARFHGATRATGDVDCVPALDAENMQRLAAAMKMLNARLRIAGMSDSDARSLVLKLDARTLIGFGGSTWTTDAGPLDILVELRDGSGRPVPFEQLERRAIFVKIGAVAVRLAALRDIVEAKTFASRQKDLDALPELHRLLDYYDSRE